MLYNYSGEPVDLGNFLIKKGVSFDAFIKERDRVFSNRDLCANLSTFATNQNLKGDYYFVLAVENLIDAATAKSGIATEEKKKEVNRIIDFLTLTKKEAHQVLPADFANLDDYLYNSLYLSFFALTILDKKIQDRFEVGYILEQNKKFLGLAGYSEKLKSDIPYILTFFEKKLIYVDPIKGQVETITFKEKIEDLYIKDGLLWCNDFVLGERYNNTGIKFRFPFDERQRDYRQAEREANRQKGKKVKETCWRTIGLGSLRGSNKSIKEHILIALLVYGLNTIKFAMMEGHSIMTIDHINGKHDDNRIDNFDLLTRKANNSKGDSDNTEWFDYFFYMNGCPLEKCS